MLELIYLRVSTFRGISVPSSKDRWTSGILLRQVSVSASFVVGHIKGPHKNGTNLLPAWYADVGTSLAVRPECKRQGSVFKAYDTRSDNVVYDFVG